jgi:hypothetical protein
VRQGGADCVQTTDTTIDVTVADDKDRKDVQSFSFDRVFDASSKQIDVFEFTAAPMVRPYAAHYLR